MTKRHGDQGRPICLKSMHMPLDAKPDVLAATAVKVAAAGLVLYGAGVIEMGKASQVRQAFEYGKAAGLRLLVVSPAPEMLPLVESQVKKYDISVAIHNHGPDDRRWPTPKSAYDAIASMDRRVGLCIDIGHTVRARTDLVDSVNRYHDRLLEMHIKDVTEAAAKGRCIQLGRGVIDMVGLDPAFGEGRLSRHVLASSGKPTKKIRFPASASVSATPRASWRRCEDRA